MGAYLAFNVAGPTRARIEMLVVIGRKCTTETRMGARIQQVLKQKSGPSQLSNRFKKRLAVKHFLKKIGLTVKANFFKPDAHTQTKGIWTRAATSRSS